jgi:hypothetical protein
LKEYNHLEIDRQIAKTAAMMPPTDKAATTDERVLPPEEGVQGWTCVFGSFLALFCTFGFLNA